MNMPIPENRWDLSYPVFWLICIAIAGTMIYWFRRRKWI
jgi:Mg2+ and Co2+ transporter CorA